MRLRNVLALASLAAALAALPLGVLAGPEEELLAARSAAARGQVRALEAWRARHPGHVLEPYAHFWQLQAALKAPDPDAMREFLRRNPEGPLAEALRREWLKSAAASGDWDTFRAELSSYAGDDADIACYALQERLARADPEAVGEARGRFLSGREAPPTCEPVFAALAVDAHLSEDEVWRRLRQLLAAGALREARRTNGLLPRPLALDERALQRAASNPDRYLARERGSLAARGSRELVLFAVARLARSRPDDAAQQLEAFAPRLGPEATEFAWAQIAFHAALAHDPRALEYYAAAGAAPLTESQAAWKARAALRSGDWDALLAAVDALPPDRARNPTWRYWRAQALKRRGKADAAHGLLQGLSTELNFYGLLAAEELGTIPAPRWNATRPDEAELDAIRSRPGFRRALALYALGLNSEGLREWLWALRGLGDRELLAAAEVARVADIPDRAIATADRTVATHDFSQRYPIPHRDILSAAARQWDIDEALVYSIIRQESRFMPRVRSSAGATGLMQLMPATARWVARQIPVRPYRQDMLVRPETNIRMGTYYFRRVLDDLGHPILAAAAYNAGPGRARRWRDDRDLEGAVYIETIPFNETRNYVKRVFANAWFYHQRIDGRVVSLRQLLGRVTGRDTDAPGAGSAKIP